MQQNKNMLLFTLLSVCLFAGWLYLQNQMWPAPKKPKTENKEVAQNKEGAKDKQENKQEPKPIEKKEPKEAAIGPRLLDEIDMARLAILFNPDAANVVGPWIQALKKEPETPRTIPLGFTFAADGTRVAGPKYHLEVLLTTRGAGVQQLVLNKFKAANYLGLPVPNKDLELIQDDPIQPSYCMYAYRDLGPDANPLDTLGGLNWIVDSEPKSLDDEQRVRFRADVGSHIRIVKTYTLSPEAYHIEMTLAIIDLREGGGDPVKFRYQLAGSHGLPVEGEWFVATPRTAVIGTYNKARKRLYREQQESERISFLSGGNRIPPADLDADSFIQYAGVMNQFFFSSIVVDSQEKPRNSDEDPRRFLAWARPTVESSQKIGMLVDFDDRSLILDTPMGRLGSVKERFEMLPRVRDHIKECGLTKKDKVVVSFYTTGHGKDRKNVASWIRMGSTPRPTLDDVTVRVISQDLTLLPGSRIEHRYVLYNGPAKVSQLYQFSGAEAVSPELIKKYDGLQLRYVTDFGRIWLWSDLILGCSSFMNFLLYHLRFFGDGMSIVLLTVLVRGLMFPISRKQAIYSVKMQALAPEMKKIQEKFKNDAKARTEAIMELYRKHNVHPLGGCLPILLQMPVFIGLYFALQESVHFRLARFLWFENLAAPDMLFWWSQSIPLIADPNGQGGVIMDQGFLQWLSTVPRFFYLGPFFNLLPVIAVIFMIIQQIVMTPPPQDEQQAAQFKMMRYMMVLVGIMFYKVAAGLCMYIIISTVWGLTERRFLPKKKQEVPPAAPQPAAGNQPRGPSGRKQPPVKVPEKKETGIQKVKDWWQEVLRQAKKK